jgi:hypothetical protein
MERTIAMALVELPWASGGQSEVEIEGTPSLKNDFRWRSNLVF